MTGVFFFNFFVLGHCFLNTCFTNPPTTAETCCWEIKLTSILFIIIFPLTRLWLTLVFSPSNCLFRHSKYVILTKANAYRMLKRKMLKANTYTNNIKNIHNKFKNKKMWEFSTPSFFPQELLT